MAARLQVLGLAAMIAACTAPPTPGPSTAGAELRHAASAGQAGLDPAVEAALRRMASTLAAAPALTVRLTSLKEVRLRPDDDQQVALGATVAVGLRRPDRIAALVGGDRGSFRLWFDGETATLLSLTANAYARAALPGDTETFLDALEQRLGVELPLRDLLAPDPYAALVGAGTTGVHLGRTLVNGTPCEHYALRNRDVDWQIWIAAGDRPLPCRLVVADRTVAGAPRTVLEFQAWDLRPRLPDRTFVFAAPPGATELPWLERRAAAAVEGRP